MTRYSTRILSGLAATIALAFTVTIASANSLSISNQNIRIVWRALRLEAGVALTCEVTLEGSFHTATISKNVGQLIGVITAASAGNCEGGTVVMLRASLPWHIEYAGFGGTLPRASSISLALVRFGFLFELAFVANCLFQSTAAQPAKGSALIEAGGTVIGLRAVETAQIPLLAELGGLFGCPEEITFEGTASVALLGTSNAVSITLI